MCKYGSGPAGAEPIGLGHFPVRLPERILENVGDDHRFSAIHGCAAGSRLRSDAHAVDGAGVGLGKTGSSAVPHVLPVLIEEQDRAEQAGKLGFHNPHQVLQYFLQRSIVRYHLQNAALSVTQRLRPLAFGNVNHGTHVFNKIAGRTENGMAHCVDLPDLATRMNDSVIELEPRLVTACSFCSFDCSFDLLQPTLISRMDALKECFESRLSTVRVKTQYAVTFLGPVPNVACSRGRCPTARVAESLRFG